MYKPKCDSTPNMRRTIFYFLFVCLLGFKAHAQEGIPIYIDYLTDNYYFVYPSLAGIGEGGKLRSTVRQQWFDVDDAPNLQTFNAHFRIGENSGAGVILFNDANGFHSQTGFKGTYAYHLKLGGDIRDLNQLSFGISGVVLASRLDETEFRAVDFDPAITFNNLSTSYFNVDLGLSYSFREFYAHAAVLNAVETERNLFRIGRASLNDELVVDNLRRYLFSVGYVFGRGEFRVEPSLLFQATEFTRERSIDINAKAYKDLDFGVLWGGLSYRRGFDGAMFQSNGSFGEQRLQQISPILGVNYKRFLFSYNFTYQVGDIRFDSGGFHQITLGYDIGNTTPTNKYDCYCPAANY